MYESWTPLLQLNWRRTKIETLKVGARAFKLKLLIIPNIFITSDGELAPGQGQFVRNAGGAENLLRLVAGNPEDL